MGRDETARFLDLAKIAQLVSELPTEPIRHSFVWLNCEQKSGVNDRETTQQLPRCY